VAHIFPATVSHGGEPYIQNGRRWTRPNSPSTGAADGGQFAQSCIRLGEPFLNRSGSFHKLAKALCLKSFGISSGELLYRMGVDTH
jgi:hypothetical protein